jgi:hypothetical protein
MAEKRMFAKTIIDSDAFIDMPVSSRLLYYDLGMRADDDGFVNSPKKIMRMIGATDDDIKLLIAKKFIIPFESGVVVIKHWRINNYLRGDRYKGTTYTKEKSLLQIDDKGAYTLNGIPKIESGIPVGIPSVNPDKVSIDKNIYAHFNLFWERYPKKLAKINPDEKLFNLILEKLELYKQSEAWLKDGGQFIPYPATWLNGRRWEDEITPAIQGKKARYVN